MRMMRIPEAAEALGWGRNRARLYAMVNRGQVTAARVGGVIVVDLDSVKRELARYVPYRSDSDGLVSKAELSRMLGISVKSINRGIEQGWVVGYTRRGGKRLMFDADQVMLNIEKRMRGGVRRDPRRDPDAAAGAEAGGAGPG